MYTVQVDPHTHTIFSGHAFSTIGENAAAAKKAPAKKPAAKKAAEPAAE